MRRPFGAIMQLAYVVADLDKALDYWIKVMGAGPFFTGDFEPHDQIYRGRKTSAQLTTALGAYKDMHIELVRQNNDAPSVFRETRDRGSFAVHHVFAVEPDYDAALARYARGGCLPAQTSTHPIIGRIAMVDARDTMGCFVEIVDYTTTCCAINEAVWAAHDHWDGADPLRSFHALFPS